MTPIEVRQACLDDTQAISDLFRDRISVWQRLNSSGQVEDVPYDALTIYERWLHGGPWMSVETAAIHLRHLLCGAGVPIVAVENGKIQGYAEGYFSNEPEPFGTHLGLAQFLGSPSCYDSLFSGLIETARSQRCPRVTAQCVASDADTQALYARHRLTPIAQIKRYSLSAKSGQGFYKVVDHSNEDARQIERWFMSVGRLGSAREQWETLWPHTFDALPEVRERRTRRLHFSSAGQDALVCCQPQLYAPRNAEIYLWSPKPLTSQLLTALRDWTHREGYRSLILAVTDDIAKVLGSEAEADGYRVEVYATELR